MNCKEFVGQLIELETTLSIHSHSVCNDVQKIERELFEPKCEFELYIHLELVSKELNHFAAILHVYAGGLNFMK